MAGYGNKAAPDPTFDGHDTKFDMAQRKSSTGGVGAAGFGNKSAPDHDLSTYDSSDLRFDSSHSEPYSGGHPEHKSGTVGGAGFGNKTGSFEGGNDSTLGKVMEKVGHMTHNEGLVKKGEAKRASKGAMEEDVGTGATKE